MSNACQQIQVINWKMPTNSNKISHNANTCQNNKTRTNHGKSWEIMAIIIMAFFGNVMVNLYLNNMFNILIDFFRFILV